MRKGRADRAHVAHHVQLPERVPLLVGDLLEAGLIGVADVVYEAVQAAERADRLVDDAFGLAPAREIGCDVKSLTDAGRIVAATGRDHARALVRQQPRGRQPDAAGRAGDEANAVAESEIHEGCG